MALNKAAVTKPRHHKPRDPAVVKKRYISRPEAASMIGCSPMTISKHVEQGLLTEYLIAGKTKRYLVGDVEALIEVSPAKKPAGAAS